MNIIFLGAPGAGKGTQAEKLSERFGIPQISTGAILRQELEKGSELGNKASDYINAGRLVPDDLIVAIVEKRLTQGDCESGYILDGFPRTVSQAESLHEILGRNGQKIDAVLDVVVSQDILKKRLLGRRSCSACGANFNVYFNAPKVDGKCDLCGADLSQRSDDNEETINERFTVYENQTKPLVDFYKNNGIYHAVEGDRTVDSIFQSIQTLLEEVSG